MPPFEFSITADPTPDGLDVLRSGMRRYELCRLPDLPDASEDIPVTVFARNADQMVIGGVRGNIYWNGIEVELLWVDDGQRHRGVGRMLMARAEAFARERGAVISYLRTVDARPFYERIGYTVYGVLEDRTIGTVLYHMKKRLG